MAFVIYWAESMQRFFFALWPDSYLRSHINRLVCELSGQGGQQQHPDDLHMTLAFLGSATSAQRACIERVGDKIQIKPFTLYLGRIDYWSQPRILYLGANNTPAPLASLVQQLQSGLTGCGFKLEKRHYNPHVTLVRKMKQKQTFNLDGLLEWPVDEFVLAGTHLGVKPPRYQVIKRWPLQNI